MVWHDWSKTITMISKKKEKKKNPTPEEVKTLNKVSKGKGVTQGKRKALTTTVCITYPTKSEKGIEVKKK